MNDRERFENAVHKSFPGTNVSRNKRGDYMFGFTYSLYRVWQEARRWIPVSERLPTHIHSVLGYVIKGGLANHGGPMIDVVAYNPKTNEWLQNVGCDDVVVTVSHWKPLEPPDEQEAG